VDRARRALLGGLGLAGFGLLTAGCEAVESLGLARREDRRLGCTWIVSPAWPHLLVDISSDLAVLEHHRLDVSRNYRWGLAESPADLADLVSAQIRAGVSLLVAIGTPAIEAAARATTSVPIVAVQVGDAPSPSAVEQLVRPGGNVAAAVSGVELQLERQLELVRQARPDARRVGLLWRPDSTWPADTPSSLGAAASRAGLELEQFALRSSAELDDVVASAGRAELGGLLVLPEWQTSRLMLRLIEQANKARLPLVVSYDRFAQLGALASFGPEMSQLGRAAAELTGRILEGAAPSSLPVKRVTDTNLTVNPIAAARLGVSLPDLRMQGAQLVDEEI
jgi:putative ABC transport system substrate-binding protein